jgi:hypothetical protein
MNRPIYLNCNATAPINPAVAQALALANGRFFLPSPLGEKGRG